MRVWPTPTGMAITMDGGRLMRFGMKGYPDITGIRLGRFIAIEVKTGEAKQSKDQKRWQRIIEDCGGIYLLARSVADVKHAFLPDQSSPQPSVV